MTVYNRCTSQHQTTRDKATKSQRRACGVLQRQRELLLQDRWRAALLQLPYLVVATARFNSAVEQIVDLRKHPNIFWCLLPLEVLGWATNQQCNLCLCFLYLIWIPSVEVMTVKMIAEPFLLPRVTAPKKWLSTRTSDQGNYSHILS